MTKKEITDLLYNIFGNDFKYNDILTRYEWWIPSRINTDSIIIYHDSNPISESYFQIYVTGCNYNDIINILNNSSKYGFISWEKQDEYYIEFVLYSGIKNIDI